jgi:hypothetical protein
MRKIFSRRYRLLVALLGMVASFGVAVMIVRSEVYALPGGIGFAFRQQIVSGLRAQVAKAKSYLYDSSSPRSFVEPRF